MINNDSKKGLEANAKRKKSIITKQNESHKKQIYQSFCNTSNPNAQNYSIQCIRMDDIDSFGQYIAAEMRELDCKNALQVAKDKIYDVIRVARADKSHTE